MSRIRVKLVGGSNDDRIVEVFEGQTYYQAYIKEDIPWLFNSSSTTVTKTELYRKRRRRNANIYFGVFFALDSLSDYDALQMYVSKHLDMWEI